MPLTPAEQTELALRIAGAIYLEPPPSSTLAEINELSKRRLKNDIAVKQAGSVADHDAMVNFLAVEAETLKTSLSQTNEATRTRTAVEKMIDALQHLATTAMPDQDGDGPANGTCACGLLPFVQAVETHVVEEYAGAEAFYPVQINNPTSHMFFYKTFLTNDINKRMGSFNMSGQTDINRVPTLVSLNVRRDAPLTGRDFWQLAYVLHHELVCHGFQYAAVLKQWDGQSTLPARENASQGCHWTEGWMDGVALWLSDQWAKSHKSKERFGFGGTEAVKAIMDMHKERYPDPQAASPDKKLPAGLSPADAQLRSWARSAFDMLAKVLSKVRKLSDAEAIAVQFSLRLNAHESATPVVLRGLSAQLQGTLFNEIRPEVADAAAIACLRFTENGDLGELERALETA